MSELEQLIKKYLSSTNIMQLATSLSDQPWVCTLHYYSDEDLNLYWCSTLERRHSQEIAQNQKVAATIVVHENTPEEKYVIGITVEGNAELLGSNINEAIAQNYAKKLHTKPEFIADILSGKNPHKFYRLVPSQIVLFDNKDFPDNPRQEYKLP